VQVLLECSGRTSPTTQIESPTQAFGEALPKEKRRGENTTMSMQDVVSIKPAIAKLLPLL
jgi:hypothetical protein